MILIYKKFKFGTSLTINNTKHFFRLILQSKETLNLLIFTKDQGTGFQQNCDGLFKVNYIFNHYINSFIYLY
jgi:hypothetical protein